ncbi:uncharacterized protein [Labrus bergylta]|uniref:uncharacterized protein n=1 Tax=Labrus bergylta TaxID=56723 RepID=UPI0009B413D3
MSTTVTTTAPPSPVKILSASLEVPFVAELNDRESPQFKNLEAEVLLVFDVIFRRGFGVLYVRCFVLFFRPAVLRTRMSNTEAEIGVEFARNSSADQIPTTDTVASTLVEAVSNSSNNFSLSVDSTSIMIVDQNTTTITTSVTPTSNTTSANTTTVAAVILRRLTFRSPGETFTSDLLNQSSAAFINRASLIKSSLEPIYRDALPSFISLTVISFSNGSVINNIDVQFASASVPNNTQIRNTLISAASNITAFNIDTNSITLDGESTTTSASSSTAAATTTTTVNPSTTTTATAVRIRRLTFRSSGETFTSDLLIPSSAAFRNRSSLIKSSLEPFYRAVFPSSFISFTVVSFSEGSVINNIDIGFATASLPNNTQITNILNIAASFITAFNIDTNSITLDGESTTTSASSSTAAATTTTTVNPSTTTTATAVRIRRLTFRSPGETFTSDLLIPSSAAFRNRSSLIKSSLEPFYRAVFPSSFISFTVVSFSEGSVINNIDIGFATASLPNNTQITNILNIAASFITAFNIDTNSITLDGANVSSGVSHNISLITASSLVLLSWLLSSQQ